MSAKLVRVGLVGSRDEHGDWSQASVDILVDAYGRVQSGETYGYWGRPYRRGKTQSINLWPFMVTLEKSTDFIKIDFGQEEDKDGNPLYGDAVRFGTSDIASKSVLPEGKVYIEYSGIRYDFKIARITHIETGEIFNPLIGSEL